MLALTLHGVALYFLRFPASPAVAGREMSLEVVLSAPQAPPAAGFRGVRRGVPVIGTVAPTPRRTEPPPPPGEPGGVSNFAPVPLQEPPPAVNAAQLLESARRVIREEAKSAGRGAAMGNAHPADSAETSLAKALRAPSAGEKHMDGGLVKITTVFGTVYCLKAPPDYLRDGPAEAISVPATCP